MFCFGGLVRDERISRCALPKGSFNGGNSDYVRSAGSSAVYLGRFDEALQLGHRAVDLDPLNAQGWEQLGEIEFFNGQLDKAAADCKKAVELDPDVASGHFFLIQILILQGRAQDILSEIERVRSDSLRGVLYPTAYNALGRKKESDAALRELIAKDHLWVMRSDSPFDESRTVPSSSRDARHPVSTPPPFRGLSSVLPYRLRDVGSADFDEGLPVHCCAGRPIAKAPII